MRLVNELQLSDFIALEGEGLDGWVYIKLNPDTSLVDTSSSCTIFNVDKLSRDEWREFKVAMATDGYVCPMEAWEFFGHVEQLAQTHSNRITEVMVSSLNYFIENDAWPLDE